MMLTVFSRLIQRQEGNCPNSWCVAFLQTLMKMCTETYSYGPLVRWVDENLSDLIQVVAFSKDSFNDCIKSFLTSSDAEDKKTSHSMDFV